MIKISISENQGNQRLDRFLKKYFDKATLGFIYKMIRKDVKLNGKRAKNDTMIMPGDELSIYIDDETAKSLIAVKKRVRAKRQFKIAYEDENIIICEKPFGLLTHGDRTEKKNHLANQVIDYLIEKGEYDPRTEKTFTPSPVNRLDRNTTGLVLFGKNAKALQELNSMIRAKDMVSKYYQTIVFGKVTGTLELKDSMTKDHDRNMVKVVRGDFDGAAEDTELKTMETIARPLEYGKLRDRDYTLMEVEIITGRTHQIRAHLKDAGYPVIGDAKYGDPRVNRVIRERFGWSTQLLHAARLEFKDAGDGQLAYLKGLNVRAELPDDFKRIKEEMFKK